jgi:hypothetical protein
MTAPAAVRIRQLFGAAGRQPAELVRHLGAGWRRALPLRQGQAAGLTPPQRRGQAQGVVHQPQGRFQAILCHFITPVQNNNKNIRKMIYIRRHLGL